MTPILPASGRAVSTPLGPNHAVRHFWELHQLSQHKPGTQQELKDEAERKRESSQRPHVEEMLTPFQKYSHETERVRGPGLGAQSRLAITLWPCSRPVRA